MNAQPDRRCRDSQPKAFVLLVLSFWLVSGCSRQSGGPPGGGVAGHDAAADSAFIGAKAGEEREFSAFRIRFCWCPPGNFVMDSSDTAVTLTQGFWLAKYEVTNQLYHQVTDQATKETEGGRLPVGVSWNEAFNFCRELTEMERTAGRLPDDWQYSLPTEAQWEYACRSGSTTEYCYGDDASQLGDYAWYRDNAQGQIHEIGQKKGNAWGLHDMHGNLWEWCQDSYLSKVPGGTDPVVTEAEAASRLAESGVMRSPWRVRRGGCWASESEDCESGDRSSFRATFSSRSLGVRIALNPSGPKV